MPTTHVVRRRAGRPRCGVGADSDRRVAPCDAVARRPRRRRVRDRACRPSVSTVTVGDLARRAAARSIEPQPLRRAGCRAAAAGRAPKPTRRAASASRRRGTPPDVPGQGGPRVAGRATAPPPSATHAVVLGERRGDRRALELAEARLAVVDEDVGDAAAGGGLDVGVGVARTARRGARRARARPSVLPAPGGPTSTTRGVTARILRGARSRSAQPRRGSPATLRRVSRTRVAAELLQRRRRRARARPSPRRPRRRPARRRRRSAG